MSSDTESRNREIALLNGLVNFYSKRAATHAGFVVTGVFGIYAILFNMEKLPSWAFYLSYLGALIVDLYSFANFSYDASLAESSVQELGVQCGVPELEKYHKQFLGKSALVRGFSFLRRKLLRGKKQYLILFIIWFMAVVLPLIGILWKV